MKIQGRFYPYEKSIVINALYDTIETLGLCLDSANSVCGVLIVSDALYTGEMRIALSDTLSKRGTQVDIFLENFDGNIGDDWSAVILDELSATIQKACHIKSSD